MAGKNSPSTEPVKQLRPRQPKQGRQARRGKQVTQPPQTRLQRLLENLRIWLLTWTGFGVCAGGTALTGIAIYWAGAESRLESARQNRMLPADQARLRGAIDRRNQALLPDAVATCLAELRAQRTLLLPAVLWVLNRPADRYYAATASLAADLDMTEAVPLLVSALAPLRRQHRADAVRALDRLQPIGDAELTELFADEDTTVVMAATTVLGRRTQPAIALLRTALLRLGDRREGVRAAVLAALPAHLPAELSDDVLALLADPTAADSAARLLPRLPPSEAGTSALLTHLHGMNPELQLDLLQQVGRTADSPKVREALWLLADSAPGTELRASALLALERARDAGRPPGQLDTWPPLLRYHAARIRVAAGHVDGVDQLLALADNASDRETASQARLVLTRLAHQPPHADLAALSQWRAGIDALPPADLPLAALPSRGARPAR